MKWLRQDYIMRLIKEMVRTLLKLLFHVELPDPATELFEEKEEKNTLKTLLDMVDAGNIDDAENQIYEMTEDRTMESLKMALVFYNHLNEKSNDFLEQHNFSRDEIKQGIQHLIGQYGLESIADTFLSE